MPKKIPEVITEKEFEELIKKVHNKYKSPMKFGFYQCLRLSEVLNLQVEDINQETEFDLRTTEEHLNLLIE